MPRLYLVTRADLPAGVQASQLAHAAIDFTFDHPAVAEQWHNESNTVVLLEAPDELALIYLAADAAERGVEHTMFHEPDLGGELTAVAFGPAGARLCARYPLAFAPQVPSTNHGGNP